MQIFNQQHCFTAAENKVTTLLFVAAICQSKSVYIFRIVLQKPQGSLYFHFFSSGWWRRWSPNACIRLQKSIEAWLDLIDGDQTTTANFCLAQEKYVSLPFDARRLTYLKLVRKGKIKTEILRSILKNRKRKLSGKKWNVKSLERKFYWAWKVRCVGGDKGIWQNQHTNQNAESIFKLNKR